MHLHACSSGSWDIVFLLQVRLLRSMLFHHGFLVVDSRLFPCSHISSALLFPESPLAVPCRYYFLSTFHLQFSLLCSAPFMYLFRCYVSCRCVCRDYHHHLFYGLQPCSMLLGANQANSIARDTVIPRVDFLAARAQRMSEFAFLDCFEPSRSHEVHKCCL